MEVTIKTEVVEPTIVEISRLIGTMESVKSLRSSYDAAEAEPIIDEPVTWMCSNQESDPLDCSSEFRIVPVETLIEVSDNSCTLNSNIAVATNINNVEEMNSEMDSNEDLKDSHQVIPCSILLDRNEVSRYYCADTMQYNLATKWCTNRRVKKRGVPYHDTRNTSTVFTSLSGPSSTVNLPTQNTPPNSPSASPIHQDCSDSESDNDSVTSNKVHEEHKKYICDYCNKQCHNINNLKVHLKHNHPNCNTVSNLHLSCKFCGRDCNSSAGLLKHEKVHRETSETTTSNIKNKVVKTLHSCKLCSKSFKFKGNLIQHEKYHQKLDQMNGKFQCGICSIKFIKITDLENHIQIHDANNIPNNNIIINENVNHSYYCQICKRKMPSLPCLKKHKTFVHFNFNSKIINNKLINCKPNNSITYNNLDPTKRQYLCHLCSFVCVKPEYLRSHLLNKHKKPFDYICNNCNLKFKNHSEWSNHMKEHKKSNIEYKCKFCTVTATSKHSLNVHLTTHLLLQPFSCVLCTSKFKRREGLREHYVNKHKLNKNQTVCELCKNTYLDINALNNHIIKDHIKSSYYCKYCKIYFEDKKCYIEHKKIPHFPAEMDEFSSEESDIDNNSSHEDSLHSEITNSTQVVSGNSNQPEQFSPRVVYEPGNIKCETDNEVCVQEELTSEQYSNLECETNVKSDIELSEYEVEYEPELEIEQNEANEGSSKSNNYQEIQVQNIPKNGIIKLDNCFKCNYCTYENIAKDNVSKHLNSHSIIKPFQCKYCEFKAKRREHLKTHYTKWHFNIFESITCHLCDIDGFFDNFDLQNHIARDHSKSKYRCEFCRIYFENKYALKLHLMMPHFEEETNHMEVDSNEVGNTNHVISNHELVLHQSSKSQNVNNTKSDMNNIKIEADSVESYESGVEFQEFLCEEQSGQQTINVNSLNSNTTNTESLPSIIKDKSNAINHLKNVPKIHNYSIIELDKSYKCRFCAYESNCKDKVSKHLNSHSIIKPFKCKYCDLAMKRREHLKTHYTKVHSKIFHSLTCNVCNVDGFFDNFDLQNHIVQDHYKSTYRCDFCRIYFETETELNVHQLIPHFEEEISSDEDENNEVDNINESSSDLDINSELVSHQNSELQCEQNNEESDSNDIDCELTESEIEVEEKIHKTDVEIEQLKQNRIKKSRSKSTDKNSLNMTNKSNHSSKIKNKNYANNSIMRLENSFKCRFCAYESNCKDKVSKHLNSHSIIKPFNCKYCDLAMKRREHLKTHYTKVHSKIFHSLTCNVCNVDGFFDNFDLQNHIVRDHYKSTYRCDFCRIYFETETELNVHQLIPHFEEETSLDDSNGCLEAENDVENTNSSHLDESIATELLLHQNSSTPNAPDFKSENNKLKGEVKLTMNVIEVEEKIDPEIEQLKESRIKKKILNSSIPSLENDKIFKISKSVSENQNDGIIKHKNSYICKFCSFQSTTRCVLTKHLTQHSIIKPYKCIFCNFEAKRREYLKTHTNKLHSKVFKPLTCNLCDKTDYLNEFDLQNHIIRDHNKSIYRCELCRVHFKNENYFKLHKMIPHFEVDNSVQQNDSSTKIINNNSSDSKQEESKKSRIVLESCGSKINIESEQSSPVYNNESVSVKNCKEAKRSLRYRTNDGIIKLNKNNFKCRFCSYKTVTECKLNIHLIIHSIVKPYACEYCENIAFKRKVHLQVHYKTQHKLNKTINCDICNVNTFLDTADLQNHMLRDHLGSSYRCNFCRIYFPDENTMKEHEKILHFIISKSSKYNQQNKSHVDYYKCKICSFKTNQKNDYYKHLLIHAIIKPFKCEHCSNSFKRRATLKAHYDKNHATIFKELICEKCGKYCVNKLDMENHLLREHLNSNYKCDICTLYFCCKSDLKLHKKIPHFDKECTEASNSTAISKAIVDESKQYKCLICSKSCTTINILKSHMLDIHNTHSTCPYCKKIYIKLGSHINKIHLNFDKYTCKICNDTFIGIVTYKEHINTNHAEEYTIQCKYCTERFPKRIDLKNHVKIQHEKETFLCHFCGYYSLSKSCLSSHIKYVHENGNNKRLKSKCPKCKIMVCNLNMHIEKYHTKKSKKLICNICNNSYVNLDSLRNHKFTMHNIGFNTRKPRNMLGDFNCPVCVLKFKYKETMINHYNREHVACVCDICNRQLLGKHSMEKHLEYSHGMKEKVHPCKNCKHVALTPGRLQKHVLVKHP